ncbi:MAG TPA: serine protease [Solirubrobacteraceae bacterium]
MNSRVITLQRGLVAGVLTGMLLGLGVVPSLAQSATPRPAGGGATAARSHRPERRKRSPLARSGPPARTSIVEGTLASITEFPFQVALYDPKLGSPAKGFFCGGVIVGATRVVTAAHCLIGERGQHSAPSEVEVLAGSSDLEPLDPGSIRDPVAEARVDPAYNSVSSDYDVGVLRLERPLWSGATPALDGHDAIAPLIPDSSQANLRSASALAGQAAFSVQATVSGWGDLNAEPGPTPSYPLRLHQARVPLIATGTCEEAYATIEQAITPRMLCAGSRTDSCYGDSGGPLVQAEPGVSGPSSDVLLGLVDFGNGCGQAGYPGVYLRVADPAVASFLGSSAAQTSSVTAHRSLCLRHAKHRRHASHTAGRHASHSAGRHASHSAGRQASRTGARRGGKRRCKR